MLYYSKPSITLYEKEVLLLASALIDEVFLILWFALHVCPYRFLLVFLVSYHFCKYWRCECIVLNIFFLLFTYKRRSPFPLINISCESTLVGSICISPAVLSFVRFFIMPSVGTLGCIGPGPRWSTLSCRRDPGGRSWKMWSGCWLQLKTSCCCRRRKVNRLKGEVVMATTNKNELYFNKQKLHKRKRHTAPKCRARFT